jgi:hypothetical protein
MAGCRAARGAAVAHPPARSYGATCTEEAAMLVRFLIVLVALLPFNAVIAQDKSADAAPPETVSRFLMGTRLGYITCSNEHRAFLEKWDLYALMNEGQTSPKGTPPSDESSSACIHETLLKGRGLYNDAAKHSASPAARAALREYMTTWESSLQAIRQPQRETPRSYRDRQQQVESRLNALQVRLESSR